MVARTSLHKTKQVSWCPATILNKRVSPCECKRIKRNGLHLSAAQASVAQTRCVRSSGEFIVTSTLVGPIERWTCVGSRGRRDAVHGTPRRVAVSGLTQV